MPTVERFEDLIAWQKARTLTKRIYEVTRDGTFAKDFGLANQLQRAAISTMSNIAEGFERSSSKEFQQFLSIAKSSCAEVRCQLYIALDAAHISQRTFDELVAQAIEVSKLVSGLHTYMKGLRT